LFFAYKGNTSEVQKQIFVRNDTKQRFTMIKATKANAFQRNYEIKCCSKNSEEFLPRIANNRLGMLLCSLRGNGLSLVTLGIYVQNVPKFAIHFYSQITPFLEADNKFNTFHGDGRFITVFTTALYRPQWPRGLKRRT
jgi:hypothetical protein